MTPSSFRPIESRSSSFATASSFEPTKMDAFWKTVRLGDFRSLVRFR